MNRLEARKLQSLLFAVALTTLGLGIVTASGEENGLVRVLLGQDTANASLDLNGDNAIDGGDVVKLISLLTPTPTPQPTPPPPGAKVATELLSGDPCGIAGSRFTVRVRVSSNESARVPRAADLRLYYPAERARFIDVRPGELGSALFGSEEDSDLSSYPGHFRRVYTVGNADNTSTTPTIFDAIFESRGGHGSFSVAVGTDGGGRLSLVDVDSAPIYTVAEGNLTTDLCSGTPTPLPTLSPTSTISPTASPSPTISPTASPTRTRTPSPTATRSPIATLTATPSPETTYTPTATVPPTPESKYGGYPAGIWRTGD